MGLDFIPSVGVLSRRASQGSLLSLKAFLNKFLTILTADSALPLDLGYLGEEVTCLNSQSVANCINSWLTICDPLSVTRQPEMQWRLYCSFKNCITELDVVSGYSATSMKSEK